MDGYQGFWAEIRTYPSLHRAVVYLALIGFVGLFIEGAFLMPYLLLRWGVGFSVE